MNISDVSRGIIASDVPFATAQRRCPNEFILVMGLRPKMSKKYFSNDFIFIR